jgi:hypothetical protein
MKPSPMSRHLLPSLALTGAMTVAIVAYAQPGINDKGDDTTSRTDTVTHNEPPPASDYWTPEKMRAAKAMPMPSIDGPPVPQQTTPFPDTGPVGSSPPGEVGGPVPR